MLQVGERAYDPGRSDSQHLETLDRVFDLLVKAPAPKVAIFDLDSTLFDNRPRQAQIFREFGVAAGLPLLAEIRPEHFVDWDLKKPLLKVGVDPKSEAALPLKSFWKERFFTSDYCLIDVAFPGAAAFVTALYDASVTIVYLTGRHEGMRQGTAENLRRSGFPLDKPRAQLVMKPALETPDTEFKASAHASVHALGRVIAAFDNEPAHANGLKASFPEAHVVWIDSDRSSEPIDPRGDLLKTYGFAGFKGYP